MLLITNQLSPDYRLGINKWAFIHKPCMHWLPETKSKKVIVVSVDNCGCLRIELVSIEKHVTIVLLIYKQIFFHAPVHLLCTCVQKCLFSQHMIALTSFWQKGRPRLLSLYITIAVQSPFTIYVEGEMSETATMCRARKRGAFSVGNRHKGPKLLDL